MDPTKSTPTVAVLGTGPRGGRGKAPVRATPDAFRPVGGRPHPLFRVPLCRPTEGVRVPSTFGGTPRGDPWNPPTRATPGVPLGAVLVRGCPNPRFRVRGSILDGAAVLP